MSFRSSMSPLALAAALAVGLAGAAAAQDSTGTAGTEGGGDRHQMIFKRIDADSNGTISSQEMETWRSAAVFRLDADGDGKVTKEEVEQHMAQRQAEGGQAPDSSRFFSTYDANGDGAVDQDELKNGGNQRFQTADTDANGELSMEEWTALQGS